MKKNSLRIIGDYEEFFEKHFPGILQNDITNNNDVDTLGDYNLARYNEESNDQEE